METPFQQIKTSITIVVTLRLPITNHPLISTVEYSGNSIGCVQLQKKNEKGELEFIFYISPFLTTNEQQLCTTYRELSFTRYTNL